MRTRCILCSGAFGLAVVLGSGCASDAKSGPDETGGTGVDSGAADAPLEPLDLPADPGATGVPVGVRTLLHAGVEVQLWYPAAGSAAGQPGESVALADQLPPAVTEALGEVSLPEIPSIAVRDAPQRNTGAPLPVVLFSHGFGGFAEQSVDLTTHLASRGYAVFAMDHAGRSIADLLPCIFSPPLEGCSLGGADPGPADLSALLDALELGLDGVDTAALDLENISVVGHSAGGGTASALASQDLRIDAAVVMAAPPVLERQLPLLLLDGSCDAIVPETQVEPAFSALDFGARLRFVGAGHLAFSDLCTLDFGRLADEVLSPRDDVNTAILGQLIALGTDGCPGGTVAVEECGTEFLELETSAPVVRASVTAFLDEALRGEGSGLAADYGGAVELTTQGSAR